MTDRLIGYRKLIVFVIAVVLLVINHWTLILNDEAKKALAAIVVGFMGGNGLEHLSALFTTTDVPPRIAGAMARRSPLSSPQPPSSMP